MGMTLIWLIVAALILTAVLNWYFHEYRNTRVCRLREQLNKLSYAYAIRHIPENEDIRHIGWHLLKRYSYMRMVYSFKPIKLESWYTTEEIEKLKNG